MTATPIHFRLHHTQGAASFAKLVADDARFAAVLPGTPQAAHPAGLVLVEVKENADVALIPSLLASPLVQEIFVIGPAQDANFILTSMRAGATEYLPMPLKVSEFRAALERFVARNARSAHAVASVPETTSRQPGRIVHLVGGKQGTGVTTLATNLGVESAMLDAGRPAALVDMRQPQGEVPLFLDVHYTHTWAATTHNANRLDETFMQSLMVRHASGLDILAAPDRSEDTGAAAPQAIATMLRILRTQYATTIVDGSPVVDELSLAAMREADSVLMVTELSLPCLASSRRLLDTLDSIDPEITDKIQIIVNRYTDKAGVTLSEAEELLGTSVAWKIDEDYIASLHAINQGQPLRDAAPKSALTKSVARLAASFGTGIEDTARTGLFGKLLGKKRAATVPSRKAESLQRATGDDTRNTIPMHVLQGAGG